VLTYYGAARKDIGEGGGYVGGDAGEGCGGVVMRGRGRPFSVE
jgi:hypothetical protein